VLKISCVAAILENSNDKVLLQLRDDKSSLSFASHWTLPGGKVEERETPDEAICRELILDRDLTHSTGITDRLW
jgi:ADP-ribose pyrophosphatase YjhB (NUDIX family)